jgi:Ubiquitin family
MRYIKVGADEETGHSGNQDDQVTVNAETESQVGEATVSSFTLKVLFKEKSIPVEGLSTDSTIAQLKSAVENVTEVSASDQRLIFAGRPLKPDDKTLSSFKIVDGSSIHLFPIPRNIPTVSARVVDESGTNADGSSDGANARHPIPFAQLYALDAEIRAHRPVHFDPEVSTHVREVRLWSVILSFVCTMTLFNNISFNLSTGKLGNNYFDAGVHLVDTVSVIVLLQCCILVTRSRVIHRRDLSHNDRLFYIRYLLMCFSRPVASLDYTWRSWV